MMRRRLFVALRSVLIGWATLLFIACLVPRPLLAWTAPILGAKWLATAGLALDCATLVATGWVVGRLNRTSPIFGVLVFAATLAFRDFTPLLAINIPWLLYLAAHALSDSHYLSSLVSTTPTQALLLATLVAGGLLRRPPENPLPITPHNT